MVARRALSELNQTSPWICVAMSLLAGLSTTLGAGLALMLPGQRVSRSQMAFALALAGGVMVSVTLLEFWLPMFAGGRSAGPVVFYSLVGAVMFLGLSCLVPEPQVVDGAKQFQTTPTADLEPEQDSESATLSPPEVRAFSSPSSTTSASTTVGAAAVRRGAGGVSGKSGEEVPEERLQDRQEEDGEEPELESGGPREEERKEDQQRKWRLAAVLMLALTAHNFPEGFAVAISALQSESLGIVVMFAIAMHNIPEGISIALPVYSATGSRWQALWMSFLSGMAEPLGAISALLVVHVLGGDMSEESLENLLCTVGGVMCAVAVKELLPEAWRQNRPAPALSGFVVGCLVMWVTSRLGA